MTSETAPPSPDGAPTPDQRCLPWRESLEWISSRDTLARLREEDTRVPPERRVGLARARAFVDVADWVLTSTSDASPEPIFTLYRQAIAALLLQDFAAYATLAAALTGASPTMLEQAVGGAANFDRLRAGLLADTIADAPLAEQIALVHLAQDLAHGLLEQAPAQRLQRALARRGRRILFTVVALLAAIAGIVALGRLLLGPVDLARGKTWRTSSDLHATFSADLLFHTAEEMNPWFEIDLGSPVPVRGLWVKNRLDCCLERAVPLVAELSVDRVQWLRPAEQDLLFTFWTPTFPPTTARYVRLRSLRFTALHLAEVKVF
jgi:hypothetical protein